MAVAVMTEAMAVRAPPMVSALRVKVSTMMADVAGIRVLPVMAGEMLRRIPVVWSRAGSYESNESEGE